jgi:L-threonylcarbamoyladenylate synthase
VKTEILGSSPQEIEKAALALIQGEVVGMPTETVYGLAGNALNEAAAARIFAAKERPTFDPLIVHLAILEKETPFERLEKSELVDFTLLSDETQSLIRKIALLYWPGPLTLILPKSKRVPDLITSGLPSVAIRFPSHPVAQALLRACVLPLAAPSANRFGRISPTTAQAVFDELQGRIPYIIEGGPSEIGVESTVLKVSVSGNFELLRPGKISFEELKNDLKDKISLGTSHLSRISHAQPQLAPGLLESHYAPQKPFYRVQRSLSQMNPEEIAQAIKFRQEWGPPALLLMEGKILDERNRALAILGHPLPQVAILSPSGEPAEMARNLFQTLRQLDQSDECRWILGELPVYRAGLYHAIADRLTKASLDLCST